jgi:hypothetical protein
VDVKVLRLVCGVLRITWSHKMIGCCLVVMGHTWSKSMRRRRLTPERSNMFAAWLPTPPSPITTTNEPAIRVCASFPKNWMFRVNCSDRISSSSSEADPALGAPPTQSQGTFQGTFQPFKEYRATRSNRLATRSSRV